MEEAICINCDQVILKNSYITRWYHPETRSARCDDIPIAEPIPGSERPRKQNNEM